ncbi:MAG: lipoyl synthase [Candidatus Omnitrophica bacterium]|nr:lipoyl synthase [Candidatus Omnitrophota bacterium]
MRNRLPGWFGQDLPDSSVQELQRQLKSEGIHTVCQEAKCPNINSCFKQGTATFLILGDKCTRACAFCAIKKAPCGTPPDQDEPARIACLVRKMGLDYAVITSVTRDDLMDGGSRIFIDTIACLRESSPKTRIELLIPDFKEDRKIIKAIVEAKPDVIGHNLETVSRFYPLVRPQADYKRSLQVLKLIKEFDPKMVTKSSLILGLGESNREVIEVMHDLRMSGCDILVLGQYLRPSAGNYPVKRFVAPAEFDELAQAGQAIGFRKVISAPKARSSYQASLVYGELNYA